MVVLRGMHFGARGQKGGVFREGFFSCYISTIRPLGFFLAAAAAFVGLMNG